MTSDDYRLFLHLAGKVIAERSWICLSYCLMPNHYHLVVETPGGDLSAGMQQLNGRYAGWFNHLYGLSGHVFQGRFHSALIETDGNLLAVIRYVARNPVRGRLCANPADWEWSSHAASVGLRQPRLALAIDRLLALFSADPARARGQLRLFVEDLQFAPGETAHSDMAGVRPRTWPL